MLKVEKVVPQGRSFTVAKKIEERNLDDIQNV
jgi:hypothetical protein